MADHSLPPAIADRIRALETRVENLSRAQTPVSPNLFQLADVSGQPASSGQVLEYDRATGQWVPGALTPAGFVTWSASNVFPSGRWLAADGSAVSRTTYAELFAAIGTTYGVGDGSTTFNVPNLQGRLVIGVGTDALGATGGSRNAITVSHTHPGFDHVHGLNVDYTFNTTHGHNGGGIAEGPNPRDGDASPPITTGSDGAAYTTGSTGSSGTNANLPPFIALWAYIRY